MKYIVRYNDNVTKHLNESKKEGENVYNYKKMKLL